MTKFVPKFGPSGNTGCEQDISRTIHGSLTKCDTMVPYEGLWSWLDFGDVDLIFKVTVTKFVPKFGPSGNASCEQDISRSIQASLT